jgi:hypothetical protein
MAGYLFASLVWGSIGTGFLVYGMRQRSAVPTIGGVLMMVASYFAGSPLTMSLICAALVFAVYMLTKDA